MSDYKERVDLDVESRQKDIRVDITGREHSEITLKITGAGTRKSAYDGPYSVISVPREMQILQTNNKVMTENLIVLPISYFETSNPKGGLTVYIGGD